MELSEKIAKIIAGLRFGNSPLAVAVSGAADLGKTHLASGLVNSLNIRGISADHLTLDSYLMAREKRIETGVSGYEIEAYDLAAIENDLAGFMQGLPIEFHEYDHAKGSGEGPERVIQPCQVLIVDGLHAMHERFKPFINYSIFVCTDDDQLQAIRHSADIAKRKQTVEFSKSNLGSELEKYKEYVAPYKNKANIVLTLTKKWQYSMQITD